jgi:gamma-glutamyl hercynylcysteine S-oxide synthase
MIEGIPPVATVPVATLAANMRDARARTHELLADLDGEQMLGPKLRIVNPLLWEIGHVAWFHEHFILQRAYGHTPISAKAQTLYDSIAIAHDQRWDLALLTLPDTLEYMREVHERLLARLSGPNATLLDSYLYQFTTSHEDMHDEAFTWARQTLSYPTPRFAICEQVGPPESADAGPLLGDAQVPGGTFLLGALGDSPFVFDNEKWCHPVAIEPFSIAKAPVTNSEFAAFVDEGGYTREEFWDEAGWRWRCQEDANQPVYWRADGGGGWCVRHFDAWRELAPHQPVIHVNWFEASAWCRWAGRRLPLEKEWEVAALASPGAGGAKLAQGKRRYPWGDEAPTNDLCNLDGRALGCVDVAACADTDSAFGCRQMIGNVWEWCEDYFLPYPGFVPDAYKEYSQTLFGTTRVLRGGAWATRSRMITGLYRNYFGPDRRDVLAGFRTCATTD